MKEIHQEFEIQTISNSSLSEDDIQMAISEGLRWLRPEEWITIEVVREWVDPAEERRS